MNLDTSLHSLLDGYRYFVFDLDGTLTRAVHDFVWIREQLNIPQSEDILSFIAALPDPLRQEKTAHLDELEHHFARQASAQMNAVEAIKALHARGVYLGILTRNTKAIAEQTLAALNILDCFDPDAILGRDEAKPKPDADGLGKIASLWQSTTDQMVMIGDFRFDLEAGRNAGAFTVHVHSDLEMNWPELTDLRVAHLGELFTPPIRN